MGHGLLVQVIMMALAFVLTGALCFYLARLYLERRISPRLFYALCGAFATTVAGWLGLLLAAKSAAVG